MFALLAYEIAVLIVTVAVLTVTGAPMTKFLVRSLTWGQSARVCALAALFSFGIYFVTIYLLGLVAVLTGSGGLRAQVVGYLGIVAFIGTGWFLSRNLRSMGYPQSFPGVGAKVVVGWVILSWIAVAIGFMASKIV
jgi:hypothetical protein